MHNFVHLYITFLSLILSASQKKKKFTQDCEFALALTVTFLILLKVITVMIVHPQATLYAARREKITVTLAVVIEVETCR